LFFHAELQSNAVRVTARQQVRVFAAVERASWWGKTTENDGIPGENLVKFTCYNVVLTVGLAKISGHNQAIFA